MQKEDTYADIKLVITNPNGINESELSNINIDNAIAALDEALPELPEGYHWSVVVNE